MILLLLLLLLLFFPFFLWFDFPLYRVAIFRLLYGTNTSLPAESPFPKASRRRCCLLRNLYTQRPCLFFSPWLVSIVDPLHQQRLPQHTTFRQTIAISSFSTLIRYWASCLGQEGSGLWAVGWVSARAALVHILRTCFLPLPLYQSLLLYVPSHICRLRAVDREIKRLLMQI